MADDIARLGYEIDSSQTRTAATNLDAMAAAAGRAAGSADGLMKASNGIATAHTAGALSANKLAAAQRAMKTQLDMTTASAVKHQAALRGVNNVQSSVGNQFAQLNDIVVTSWGGMNPALIGMQQGMQMVQGFAGQTLPQALGTLKGAFATLLSPTTLLTVGVIAGGAALIQWGMSALSAGEEADELTKKLESTLEAQTSLNDEIRGFRLGASPDELVLLDAISAKRREISELQEKITPQTRIQINAEKENLQELLNQLDTQRELEAQKARMVSATNELADAEREIWTAAGLTEEQLRANEQITQLLKAGVSATVIEAMQLAGVDMASPVSAAAREAAILASNLGIALSVAMQISNWQATADMTAEDQAMGMPIDNRGAAAAGRAARLQYDLTQSLKNAGRSGGSSGGGGGGGRSSQREADLESFIQSLQTERETLEAWRTEQMELLAQFNDAELMAIGGKNEAKIRLEQEYQERMAEIRGGYHGDALSQTETFMGDMASALAGGNEKMARIGQAFASVEALINAYRAYNQVLADPSLPWFAKIPAAVSVLAAGLKTVQTIKGIGGSSGGGGSGGGRGSAPSGASTGSVQEPERVVRISVVGDKWMKDLVEGIAGQLYSATRDGTRVIVQR